MLESADERALSDDQLLRMCANLQGITYSHETEQYALNGQDLGPPVRGRIERTGPIVVVTVMEAD
jgi:hypothetical protein